MTAVNTNPCDMSATNPCEMSATLAREMIGTGQLSPVELLESCLERADAVEPAVNALVARDDDAALAAAKAAAAMAADEVVAASRAGGSAELGALHGLPLAVKDINDVRGLVTSFGAVPFAGNVAAHDDPMVARLRAAGAVVIGKTNTPELSIGANTINRLYGATGNPFDVELTCGGSSGGSAVALACGMTSLATGSDHGGSLRIPASYCGVVGHRSTPGTVPLETRTITQTNYSVQGPMARNVPDAALMLSVLVCRDRVSRRDPMAFPILPEAAARFANLEQVDLSKLRVGVSTDLGGLLVSKVVREAFTDRVGRLASHVAEIVEPVIDLSDAPAIDWQLRADVFATQYHRSIHKFDEGFNTNVRRTYETALGTTVLDIAKARRRQAELFAETDAVFDECDVLLCPGVAVSPFNWRHLYPPAIDGMPVKNYMGWLALTSSLTVVGHPVTAIACGLDSLQLPFGLQVVGPCYSDARLLAVAAALEAVFADDPVSARPVPDIESLAATTSTCRTEGKLVAKSAGRPSAAGTNR